ncbi:MAG: hypothetical protein JXA43_01340, partial [Candidatus Diapherotrites archaeon]|nr:hypothetical protein [Candidatus Diapherotrites archaeon]
MRKILLVFLVFVLAVQFVNAAVDAETVLISYPGYTVESEVYMKNLTIEQTRPLIQGYVPESNIYTFTGTLVATEDFDGRIYLIPSFDDSLSLTQVTLGGEALPEYKYIYKYIDIKLDEGEEKRISFNVEDKINFDEDYVSFSFSALENIFIRNYSFTLYDSNGYFVSTTQTACEVTHLSDTDRVECDDTDTSGFNFYADAYEVDNTQAPAVSHTELLKLDSAPMVYYVIELNTPKYFTALTTNIQLGEYAVPHTKDTTYAGTTLTVKSEKPTKRIKAILRQSVESPFNFWRGDTQVLVAYAPDYDLEFEYTGTELNQYENSYETELMESRVKEVLPVDYIIQGYYKDPGDAKFKLESLGSSEHLATVVQYADLEAFPTKRGFAVMKANYSVINTENGKILEVIMPSDAEVWAVLVDNESHPILMQGNVLKLQLPTSEPYGGCSYDYYGGYVARCEPTPGNYQPISITVLYAVSDFFQSNFIGGGLSYVSPTMKDVIIGQANFRIAIPNEFNVISLSSNPEIDELRTQERYYPVPYAEEPVYRTLDMTAGGEAKAQAVAEAVDAFNVESPTAAVQEVKLTYRGVP